MKDYLLENPDLWPEQDQEDVESEVCNDILDRQRRGIAKYGTTVAMNPLELREWMQHMYEELLDAAVYVKRAMRELPDA